MARCIDDFPHANLIFCRVLWRPIFRALFFHLSYNDPIVENEKGKKEQVRKMNRDKERNTC
jgi:hypothetical protein